jgi:hypothetical protein
MKHSKAILILGDVLAVCLVTIIGFATHNESGLSFLPRMAAELFPLAISWFMLAALFGLFQDEIVHNARELWRPAFTALFAAPLAAVLRGFILNAPIIPIFAVVLGVTTAFGIVFWRWLYFLLSSWIHNRH